MKLALPVAREGSPLRRFDCEPPARGELVLARDGGGLRHFLDGRPVQCGDVLEMSLGGMWGRVRYEASLFGENPPALIYVNDDSRRPFAAIATDRFRWPKERAK